MTAAQQYEECQLVTLAGIGAHNAGMVRRILTPFDLVEPLESLMRARVVCLRRWRRLCRAALANHAPAGTLRTIGSARIDLLQHQLEPALALLRGMGSRVLLADEVGLGKTIQAGLVISELRRCKAAERVLVLTPAGLREQWAEELAGRFGLDSTIVDMRDTRRRAELLPVGLNPWSTLPIAIASIDYVKRPEVLPAVLACRWDVIVVDEVHGVTPGSDRWDAVSAICQLASYVVLLTATPHNGDHRAFLSLCSLGAVDGEPILVFRRNRREVTLGSGRRVHLLMVRPSLEEQRMHQLLASFTRAVHVDRGKSDRDARLALTIFHKRAFSSAYSLEQSVVRRLSLLTTDTPPDVHQLLLPLDEGTGELNPADEPPVIHAPLLANVAHERQQLQLLAEAARAATLRETKLARLSRLLRTLERMREPAIIFTEYRDTLLHVQRVLSNNCAILHGGLTRAERRAALDAFSSGRESLLLATDAAGEGLNLQTTCRLVINLELPWNPMRLEQRIGRVDRIGQQRTVHAVHLVASGTGETRILQRLRARVAQAQADVGASDALGPMTGSTEADEDATSRLVVDNDASEATNRIVAPEPDASLTFVRLTGEAAAEHSRLTRQRTLASWAVVPTFPSRDVVPTFRSAVEDDGASEDLAPRGVLLAFTRRRALRELLGTRALVLIQTVCEDACGRGVAAHLTPITIPLGTAPADIERYENFVKALPLEAMDPSLAEWQERTLSAHHDFWVRRLTRERAIARLLVHGKTDLFQPGLFDRRADREHLAITDDQRDLKKDVRGSIRVAEAAVDVTIRRAHAVLVLLAGGRR